MQQGELTSHHQRDHPAVHPFQLRIYTGTIGRHDRPRWDLVNLVRPLKHQADMSDLRAGSKFDLVDTDKSGTISRAEYEAAYGTFRAEAEFDQADTNKDGELSRQEYVAAYGTMGHFHLYTRSYHLGLPALAALLISAAVREAAIHGHFFTIWTIVPIFAACLALFMWFALRWMVPTVDWLADNPFSEARVQNVGSGPVRFVWSDTACGRRLPMLQIIEPKDENERRAVAVEVGRLLAPFAHEAVFRLFADTVHLLCIYQMFWWVAAMGAPCVLCGSECSDS